VIQPILDRVLVRRLKKENKSLIQIADKYREQSRRGLVVALGHGVVLGQHFFPLTDFLKVGDQIRFGEYNAEPLDDEGDPDLLIVRIQDVRGFFREENDGQAATESGDAGSVRPSSDATGFPE